MLNPMLNPNPLYTRTHCTYLDRHLNSEFNLSCAINNYILHRFTAFTHEIEYFIYYIRYPQGRQSAHTKAREFESHGNYLVKFFFPILNCLKYRN